MMFGSMIPWRERSLFPTTDRFSRVMENMENEMENLMERYFGGDGGWMSVSDFVPRTDLVESEGEFEVTVDLPGLKPEEVNVEVKNGDLWISGKREEEKEEKGKTYHRVERRHGEFRRVVSLPSSINEESIEAKFEHGVLKITLPKTQESKTKHIEIKP
jgi:HSP20 family protein